MDYEPYLTGELDDILDDIMSERARQDAKWGPQRDLDFTLWMTILGEEFGEACQAVLDSRPDTLTGYATLDDFEAEMVQVAAVSVAILENIALRKRGGYRLA